MDRKECLDQRLRDLETYLKPVSTPEGYTSREIVRRAIEFDDPPRVPYTFLDPPESDMLELGLVAEAAGTFFETSSVPVGEIYFDEWGVGQRATGRAWGHPEVCPLADLSALEDYQFPPVLHPEMIAAAKALVDLGNAAGKYVLGGDPVMGIERLRMLMGFENLMVALYTDRDRLEILLDKLTDMAIEGAGIWAEMGGVHGFVIVEDWGLQNSLQIRPELWREVFKPRYARLIEAVHRGGMHHIWHCCGYIIDIIPDMIEMGVDALQIDQPQVMGVDRLTEEFGGKICFWNPVDIQWSARAEVSNEEIREEAMHMLDRFARFGGGFIAKQYPQWWDIGLTSEKNHAIYEAFMEFGCA